GHGLCYTGTRLIELAGFAAAGPAEAPLPFGPLPLGLASAAGVSFFTKRWGQPPGSLMRAGTPTMVKFSRTSVSTRLFAVTTTLLPILALPMGFAPAPK